ncbi:Putative ABC transporter substrate-binding protein YesO [Paenibacillus konkukensis]|uniref:ABC transporter substrate-binding protein YesO n=1 Tax=Paenibacillus konkukensis TaxID=2020716 RepID=A0ABY4RHD4_9BACL|nr:extracellular solute-binding protein [Paenibacillus konkukensis]UQZ81266.1 Putative ABC transporter substrate-binding protein YesO [Paenibacillus konkukensis]
MKRISLAVISGMLAVTVTACTGGSESNKGGAAVAADGKKIVTVSVLQADKFLKLAEQQYERSHPDIDIQIKEYQAAPDGGNTSMKLGMDSASFEKYVNSVNTEVLSGKGADLISLQNLPVSKYAGKKLLADLNEMMANDKAFDINQYYGNILNSTKQDGGLYAMPLSFSLNTLLGDAAAIRAAGVPIDDRQWTWDKFAEIAKQLTRDSDGDGTPDKYVMTNNPPESLLVNVLGDHYGKYVDPAKGEARFDSKEFMDLMKQIKQMYDDGLLSDEATSWGNQFFSPWSVNSLENFVLYPKSVYDDGKVYRKPGTDQGITFLSRMMFGINAKSGVKPEAWDFLKFLLSEDMQSSPDLNGFPLHRAVAEKQLGELQEKLKQGAIKLLNGAVPKPLTDEELQSVREMIAEANSFTQSDAKVNSIVGEESKSYFAGQKSAEETAKLIQNRVTTYLNE